MISGGGRYVEDLVRPGTLAMAVVRSPHAHARIDNINTAQAQAIPGVVAVLTASDFKGALTGTHPVAPAFVAEKHTVPDRFPIAESEVVFQGEPVAVVVAESRKIATDAAEAVEVQYTALPAVQDRIGAPESATPKANPTAADNIGWDLTFSPEDGVKDAFAQAEIVVKERILQQRLAPTAIETRGVMAGGGQYEDQR